MDLTKLQNIVWPHQFYETDQQLAALLNYIPDAIIISDEHGKIVYINAQAVTLFGYSQDELLGQEIELLIPNKMREHHRKLRQEYAEYPVMRDMGRNLNLFGLNKSEREIPVDISLSPLKTERGYLYLAMVRDISEKKETEEYLNELVRQLEHLAHHDPLTTLPNRLNFIENLTRQISSAERYDELLGLLFMDLDFFKVVNDEHGHDIGDSLLIEISKRIKGCLRNEDLLARFGGDEFAILLPRINTVESSQTVAKKIIEACKQPVLIGDKQLQVGTSIGIAHAPKDSHNPDELLKLADIEMYKAKHAGRNSYSIHT